jgi:hypothetical protein
MTVSEREFAADAGLAGVGSVRVLGEQTTKKRSF